MRIHATEDMIKAANQAAVAVSKMGIPAAQFAKAVEAIGKLWPPIPVDNSLRGRLSRIWNRFVDVWEIRMTWILFVIFATLTVCGILYLWMLVFS